MSHKHRIPWADGLNLAVEMVRLLEHHVDRIAIAGSIRRGKDVVGDVELVAEPRISAGVDRLLYETDRLLGEYVVEKRLNKSRKPIAWGKRFRAMLYKGFAVDLFIVQRDRQWGPTYLIRTGPGAANTPLVAIQRIGGMMPQHLRMDGGALVNHFTGEVLDTPTESDVFQALGLPWIPPYMRSEATYALAQHRHRIPCGVPAGWSSSLGHLPMVGEVWWGGKPYMVDGVSHLAGPVVREDTQQHKQAILI